ncbi:MAG: type I restriction enzyme HsdR N-terminal domain-containing protein [Nostoc sp. DedQUE05]|uniref:type I restriction enzyme HsdR N-terminal domain-containing protein n=1 Tax=Nostoc sp. DedQUE05 TaxID=3075391 RepID=UPI002AD3B129|nr:type I restriction enzyme HsdR N-terminal domain-containing protein [Nostoc sp. DedQUE05]MDZ8092285.1 type I restriction enzyme HsdR N-terminal domain-containing protein [Nostoc sp. DedQUE05]
MTYLNEEIQQKLEIYIKKYNQQYIKCLIRGIEIPINGRPEELVRQIFIHFLIKESKLLSDKITIKVEANNHDIEIYKKQKNETFKPHQNPLMIVEVKREDVNLQNYYNQIERYLTNSGCNIGILYNYHEIIALIKKHNQFKIYYPNHLTEIQELILQVNSSIDKDLLEFENAQNGNLESFIYLLQKYGKYTNHTISFKLKHQLLVIDGYLFTIQDNKIYYKICGQYSKKQQVFDCQDFEKLISIIY